MKTIVGIVIVGAIGLGGGLGMGGCESPPDLSPSGARGDPYLAPTHDPQIAILSPELQPWLGFHPARVRRSPTETLEVEIPMRNLTDRQYLLDYRIIFYDDQDMQLDPVMGWTMLPLLPRQTTRLTGKSLSAEAEHYRVEVKWAK